MYLALRSGAATDATWLDKLFIWVIKERLVTVWPHAGIVIGDTLYHATARHGFCKAEYTPHRWTLIPLGEERDAEVQALAEDLIAQGTGYDFAELLDFTPLRLAVRLARLVPPLRRWLDGRLYCYQWCWLAMTGRVPSSRVTAELLQGLYIKQLAGRLKGVAL
jgi:hypothetical protein